MFHSPLRSAITEEQAGHEVVQTEPRPLALNEQPDLSDPAPVRDTSLSGPHRPPHVAEMDGCVFLSKNSAVRRDCVVSDLTAG